MEKHGFLNAVETLKLYRRAELVNDQGHKLVSELYVDPLPDNHILHTVLRPNTTFLVGRKGTGKSTIFQRAQESLNSNKNTTWAYIDIKTLYEASTSEVVGSIPDEIRTTLSPRAIEKICVFKNFILELIKEIKNQIDTRISSNIKSQIKEAFTGSAAELFEKLDEFVEELKRDQFINVTGGMQATKSDEETERETGKTSAELKVKTTASPSAEAKILAELVSEAERKNSNNYSQVFIRIFNIRKLIIQLKEILNSLDLRHLYIFIDDFSELPKEDMEQVVDTIIGPLNNWSEEFIKLKVAVYPGRIYAGEIDMSKVDEVYLDIYRAYGRNDVAKMEERAIDFTRRLVSTRLKHYCKTSPEEYIEKDSDDFWRILFYASIGNPRIIGYLLYFSYENTVIYGKKIGIRTLQDAARRYYEEKIEHYFRLNKFLHETFEERSSIYSLKELLEELVKRSKSLRNYRDSKVMKEIPGRPPTSHFHIKSEYDTVLSTLELNFFITKYYEMKDRDGKEVDVFALNYGLCQQEAIAFGRPQEKREHRLYFIERIFDYTPIITSYIKVNQEIVCDECHHRHGHEMLSAIQQFGMLCPKCKSGTCRIVNLSKKYEELINSVSEEHLLPRTELGIIKTLHDERKQMFAKEIASELDCSYQLIGKRGRNLSERGLIKRGENTRGRRTFNISETATSIYFEESLEDKMDFTPQNKGNENPPED